jgi:hypothetical protein
MCDIDSSERILKCNPIVSEKDKKKDIQIIIWTIVIFIIVVALGTIGYKFIFDISWIDAFYAASLVLTAISETIVPTTTGQKLFVIFYSFVSVVIFLSLATNTVSKAIDLISY